MALRKETSIRSSIDWISILLFSLLVGLGWLSIYAASYNPDHPGLFDLGTRHGKQLLWIITSLLIIFTVMMTEPKFFTAFAWVIYALSLLSLVAVLLMGKEVAGSKSWVQIGSFALQPAEFAKIATALALARFLGGLNVRLDNLRTRTNAALIILGPALLILLQYDTGSAMVFSTFVLVLYREGLPGTILLIAIAAIFLFIFTLLFDQYLIMAILGALALIWWYLARKSRRSSLAILGIFIASIFFVFSVDYSFENIIQDHQRQRINVLLGLETDIQGAGYNVHQSKIAIGSGGFTGKGFLKGTQTKFDFVPAQSTDFIFCTVGEEWGFLGTSAVVILFVVLLLRLLKLAERQRSVFSRVYGYAVASILFFHFAINVGMTIGLVPVIGIPLPFISYGGSSLWAFTLLLFIFLRLDANRLMML